MDQPIIIDNLEVLKKRVTATGLGDHLNQQIEEQFAKGVPKFILSASETIEGCRMDFELDINSKENKGYFNGFKATLHGEAESKVAHWFKSNDRITKEEAYILLHDQHHPRAIHKTRYDEKGEKYGTWLQLDFTQKTNSGNHLTKRFNDFDLISKLHDFDFVELSSLQQKAVAAVHMTEGREVALTPVNQQHYQQVLVRANPERNTITILDDTGKLLFHDQFRTEEARNRIQDEKNAKEAAYAVKEPRNKEHSNTDSSPQASSEDVKKKNSVASGDSPKSNKRPRVIQEDAKKKKGKFL